MSEDHCVICADSLEWTGFGPCGHKEVRGLADARVALFVLAAVCPPLLRPFLLESCAVRRSRADTPASPDLVSPARPNPLPAPDCRPPFARTLGPLQACSRCVARLRFVLEDKRCMYCQQPQDEVYFTRYMGDYTHRPADFAALEVREGSGTFVWAAAAAAAAAATSAAAEGSAAAVRQPSVWHRC
jgi:hypothetical protein